MHSKTHAQVPHKGVVFTLPFSPNAAPFVSFLHFHYRVYTSCSERSIKNNGSPFVVKKDCEKACQEVQEAPKGSQDLRQDKLAKA